MRLHNLVTLVWGRPLTDPAVTAVNDFVTRASKVHRGDLFIARDPKQIDTAVARGAYAILTDADVTPTDTEIAWIRVDSLERAMARLIHFALLERTVTAIACDALALALASAMTTAHCFDAPAAEHFEALMQLRDGDVLFFRHDAGYDDLFADTLTLPAAGYPLTLIRHTLFESTFSLNGDRPLTHHIPRYMLSTLARLCRTLDEAGIPHEIPHQLPHFTPIFIGDHFEKRPFGESDRALIFEPRTELAAASRDYLHREARWARCLYLYPDAPPSSDDQTRIYRRPMQILTLLRKERFHFALIVGVEPDAVALPEVRGATLL